MGDVPDRSSDAVVASPARAFLVESLFVRALDLDRLRALEPRLPWRSAVDAAIAALVPGMLHQAAVAAGLDARPREGERRRLLAARMWTGARAATLVREAVRVQAALRAAGVESVVLKGVALAALDPGYGALRVTSDVDLLVRPGDLPACEAVLRTLGCTRVPDFRAPDGRPFAPGGDDRSGPPHAVPYLTPGGALVEPHFDLPGRPWTRPEDVDAMWARTRLVPASGGTLRVPSLEDLLGICCHHALVQHAGEAVILPRHVADVHVLGALGADAVEAARWYDTPCVRPVHDSLALVQRTRAAAGRARFPAGPVERAFSPRWRPVTRAIHAARHGAATLRAYGLRALLPHPAFLSARYRVRAGSPLVPLLYLWRPIRALARIVAGR